MTDVRHLDKLHTQAEDLENSMVRLLAISESPPGSTNGNTAHSAIISLFEACLAVLRARLSNISMAQELVDGAQENISLTLRMDDLGL
jgi:hypothetical protein